MISRKLPAGMVKGYVLSVKTRSVVGNLHESTISTGEGYCPPVPGGHACLKSDTLLMANFCCTSLGR